MNNKQKIKIEKIIEEKIKLLQHHFSKIMLQMVYEVNKVILDKEKE